MACPRPRSVEAAPKRMFAALPEVKLIASLRSPVSRAHSHYNLAVRSLPTVKMNETTPARLVEYFRPHNERLYELLGTDFGWER